MLQAAGLNMYASEESMTDHISHMRGKTPGTPLQPQMAIANANATVPRSDSSCPVDPSIFPSISQLTTKFAKL